jgi:hypothetical protein
MRTWTLGPGDPLVLTLAADFRLCAADFVNDQIWELETGGDPPALAMCTTYGLRARAMRIFPRFSMDGRMVANPVTFPVPPRLRHFYPNFLHLDFSPFPTIDVIAEYWVPDSHSAAGRFTITNHAAEAHSLLLEICGQLTPLEGQSLAPLSMQPVNILAGTTSNLAPVIFLTSGPQPGPGPYPSLVTELALPAGSSHSLTWVHAALPNPADSFELARRTAARPWPAERARIELINDSHTIGIHTGDPDWDAAFALSQKTALGLFFGHSQYLPHPSFVIARQPDHGHSTRQDGINYSPLWNGQSPLETLYIASLLPGAPELAAGLLRNFLAVQAEDGTVDWKPGLAGQHGRWLAAPLLASLAWQTYRLTLDANFLREIQPGLEAFIGCWFAGQHDRDLDGFPEWDHPLQTGLEDNPSFTVWQAGGQGADISAMESPALSAMLCHEIHAQALIAGALDQPQERTRLELKFEKLRLLTEQCWDDASSTYRNRDYTTHRSPAGKILARQYGAGKMVLNQSFPQSIRLLVRIDFKGETTRLTEIVLHGMEGDTPRSERLERINFQWGAGLAVATSRALYTRLDEVEISGAERRDKVSVQVMDFSSEDISFFLPVWAGIPSLQRARTIIDRTLFAPERFGRPFGIPASPSARPSGRPSGRQKAVNPAASSVRQAVHFPWNALIGEGLLSYGLREQAACLTTRLMAAVIQNLKQQHAFYHSYDADTGAGMGERNAVQGLAPLGLFLDVLGVEIQSPKRVTLSGKNPFPWPVTVKYRDLTVTRQADQTVIVFPNGQTFTSNDPTDAVISAD